MTFISASQVLGVRDPFKMIGVDAVPNAAQVVALQARRQRASSTLIGVGMGKNGLAAAGAESAIALRTQCAVPKVTAARRDHHLGVESFVCRESTWAPLTKVRLRGSLGANLRFRFIGGRAVVPASIVATDEPNWLARHPSLFARRVGRRLRGLAASALAHAGSVGKKREAYGLLIECPRCPGFGKVVVRDVFRAVVRGNHLASAPACTSSHRGIIA